MRTKDEMKEYARAIAEMHFYSDVYDSTPWEPFEDYPTEWIEEHIADMADIITNAMLWVQEGSLT